MRSPASFVETGTRGTSILAVTLASLALNGCFVSLDDGTNGRGVVVPRRQGEPIQIPSGCRPAADCREVPVYVHYMRNENLGAYRTVIVEAYSASAPKGTPVAQVRVEGMDASRPGTSRQGTLRLSPGEYLIRAYLALDGKDQTSVPYPYESLEEEAGTTTEGGGTLQHEGAASSMTSLSVQPEIDERWPRPLHLEMAQIYSRPPEAVSTDAELRLLLSVPDGITVNSGRSLRIRLHADADLARKPIFESSLPSDTLLVEGRKGRTEFLAKDLPLGSYVVFAFLDDNGNGFYDAGELSALHANGNNAGLVKIEASRTETLNLELSSEGVSSLR